MVTNNSASLILSAAAATVGDLFHSTAAAYPARSALRDGDTAVSYAALEHRSNCLANFFLGLGLETNDRIAVLCRNRVEYFEILLAAAKSGVILAALNWRLRDSELAHCIELVSPKLVLVSEDCKKSIDALSSPSSASNTADARSFRTLIIGEEYEQAIAKSSKSFPALRFTPETGLAILFTSGTTGLPKGALVSHRAMIARGLVYHQIMQVPPEDNFIAWTPFYHMVATDHGLATLLSAGTVWCVDGYQPEQLVWLLENLNINWFPLVPGMVGTFNAELKARGVNIKGVNLIGAMPDLVPKADIAEATRLFNAPFLNTFGATETGLPPGTGGRIAVGVVPESLAKTQSPCCDLRLEDAEGGEVAPGEPGEASMAGPTLFSGYWNNDKVNLEDFRHGRFHMGDVLRRNPDGTLDYVDRVKYMIKSGGENIYPAEIESVITADPRIETAIVVRKKDDRWGEVPVAFIVKSDDALDEQTVLELCRESLASYKKPKAVIFIRDEDIPRSTTGKIQRHILEDRV